MVTKTTIAALYAMSQNGGSFESAGTSRVSTFTLPHDRDVVQFVVAGEPVFSISNIGNHAEFHYDGFSGINVDTDAKFAALDALNYMFEVLNIDAKAMVTDKFYSVEISGPAAEESGGNEILKKFKFSKLHNALEHEKNKTRIRFK